MPRFTQYGGVNIPLVLIVLVFSILLGSNFFGVGHTDNPEVVSSSNPSASGSTSTGCCDNSECDPTKTGKTISYTDGSVTSTYGLLKSGVSFSETVQHLLDTGQVASGADGGPIVINTTNIEEGDHCNGNDGTMDNVNGGAGVNCTPIKNDLIIYVCRENCDTPLENHCRPYAGGDQYCYGNNETIYDAYFKLSDYPTPGVPDVIKQCPALSQPQPAVGTNQMVVPSTTPGRNLQLGSFDFNTVRANISSWVSPFCKPAIYLYPEEETEINVKVKTTGGLTLSLPKYPSSGWDVLASPDGKISYLNTEMDYLYYESKVPNNLIKRPKNGFVVKNEDVSGILGNLLPKLGLNQKEKEQFIEYWIKVLPKDKYIFIGVLENQLIEQMSQVEITPKPDSVLRVSLYFEILDEEVLVSPPNLESQPGRQGFTVVEWGGVFKSDKDREFSCLM